MKSRPAPQPADHLVHPRLKHDPQVQRWITRLLGDPDATASDLDEHTLAFVHQEVLRRRQDDFEPSLFQQKMIEMCPILAAPDFTDTAEDLGHIFNQPEMISLWRDWRGPTMGKGPAAGYAGAKAVMCLMGMGRTGSHVDGAYERLSVDRALRSLFAQLDGRADIDLRSYPTICRLMPKLAANDSCRYAAISSNIALLKWLRAHHPQGRQVGRRLLVDGTAIPAWVKQRPAGGKRDTPEWLIREAKLRSSTPEAGFRAYINTSYGKEPLQPGDKVPIAAPNVKSWRGYYLVAIVDQATGLPVIWTLFDAAVQETTGLVPLLSDLHRLWPEINAQYLVGDSAWNTHEICRLLTVDYGIQPVFRMKPNELRQRGYIPLQPGMSRDGSVSAITWDGRLVCSAHGKPLEFAGDEHPTRGGLHPGQSTKEGEHRIRGVCTHSNPMHPRPCGRLSLRMNVNWLRLTGIPHHRDGNPERHATRLALLARLNHVESLFNRLKTGMHLGDDGSTRTRVEDRAALEALVSLAFTSMTAFTVADQRLQLAAIQARKAQRHQVTARPHSRRATTHARHGAALAAMAS